MGKSKKYGMNTKAIHTEKRVKLPTGDVMPPIHLSTTYENSQPGEYEYFYGRSGNPTRELFERTIAPQLTRSDSILAKKRPLHQAAQDKNQ